MARTRFAPDRGLTNRMVLTMFLIGLLYVVFVGALIVLLKGAWPIVVVVAAGLFIAQFWFSDKIAAFSMGAREVTPQEFPELHGAVDRLCALADMQKPRVAVAQSDVPNAFATGRNEKNAVVCVTTGLLRRLEPEELEGVLAHELSHVAHKDVMVMTIAGFLGVLAGVITRVGVQFGMFGGFDRRDNRDDNSGMIMLAVIAAEGRPKSWSRLGFTGLVRPSRVSRKPMGGQLLGRQDEKAAVRRGRTGTTGGRARRRSCRAAPAASPARGGSRRRC